jgi:hypothetical protein
MFFIKSVLFEVSDQFSDDCSFPYRFCPVLNSELKNFVVEVYVEFCCCLYSMYEILTHFSFVSTDGQLPLCSPRS